MQEKLIGCLGYSMTKSEAETLCVRCESNKVVRNGTSKSGFQRFYCQRCNKSFQLVHSNKAYLPGMRQKIRSMIIDGCGIRETARELGGQPQHRKEGYGRS